MSASGQRLHLVALWTSCKARRVGIQQMAPNLWPVQILHNNAHNTDRTGHSVYVTSSCSVSCAQVRVKTRVLQTQGTQDTCPTDTRHTRHVSYRHKAHKTRVIPTQGTQDTCPTDTRHTRHVSYRHKAHKTRVLPTQDTCPTDTRHTRHVSYRHKAQHYCYGYKSTVRHEQRSPYVQTTSVRPHVT